MQSLAAVLTRLNNKLELMNLDIPPLKEGQVLVKMAYTGLCHSQLNEIKGKKGEDKFLPHTLGHEGSGEVVDTGQGVTKVKNGDHVVLSWISGSGINCPSAQYVYQNSIVNSGAISTFMTYAIISENRLIPIPKNICLKEAALLGCALPTGMGIVLNTLKISPGSTVAIFGIGGIGMSSLIAAKLMHASEIIAIDICDQKLSLAKKLGATHSINAKTEAPKEAIFKITNSLGVDFAIEASGIKETMETAFRCVRNKGGTCVITGNLAVGETIEINPFDLICGKRIIGTWGGESNIEKDISLYCDLLNKAKIDLKPLITHEYRLEEINKAIAKLDQGKECVRCLIKLN